MEAVTTLFQKSWMEGIDPNGRKFAKLKFFKKTERKRSRNTSAYRPISLIITLGKCTKRVVRQSSIFSGAEKFCLVHGLRQFTCVVKSNVRTLNFRSDVIYSLPRNTLNDVRRRSLCDVKMSKMKETRASEQELTYTPGQCHRLIHKIVFKI